MGGTEAVEALVISIKTKMPLRTVGYVFNAV
jgi:hypothetical protein